MSGEKINEFKAYIQKFVDANGEGVFGKRFYWKTFPEKIINNAKKALEIPEDEVIILFIDSSLTGSGKNGLAFTDWGVRNLHNGYSLKLSWNDLAEGYNLSEGQDTSFGYKTPLLNLLPKQDNEFAISKKIDVSDYVEINIWTKLLIKCCNIFTGKNLEIINSVEKTGDKEEIKDVENQSKTAPIPAPIPAPTPEPVQVENNVSANREERENIPEKETSIQKNVSSLSNVPKSSVSVFQAKDFVLIKSGKFAMGGGDVLLRGSLEDHHLNRRHYVELTRSFFMGKFPVTQAVYKKVMGTNPSYFQFEEDRPVEQVLWQNAIEFCIKASLMDGITPAYILNKYYSWDDPGSGESESIGNWKVYWWNPDATGYRLPTEAEWEYACRAGKTGDKRKDTFESKFSWFNRNSNGETHSVGQLEPNDWGLYDMFGNVNEWCWDLYDNYNPEEGKLRVDPGISSTMDYSTAKGLRVIRGGSYADYSISSYTRRLNHDTDVNKLGSKTSTIGFRVVRTVPTQGSGPTIEEWKAEESRIIGETIKKQEENYKAVNKKGCFITTAVCNNSGKPDNCYELTSFRKFRDEWLCNQPYGKEIIDEYYHIAPSIVERINKSENKEGIYNNIWQRYLSNCLRLIEEKRLHECKEQYMLMVNDLKTAFLD